LKRNLGILVLTAFALSAQAALLMAATLQAVEDAPATMKYENWFLNTAYDWQTLIAGVLAVAAALFTGWLLWIQIRDQRNEVRRQRRTDNLSARIRLPHALAELNRYWSSCYSAWKDKTPENRPDPPFAALETIMNSAAAVDEKSFQSIQKLIELAQAFEARLDNRRGTRPVNILDNMVADIAHLTYLTNRLYEFGRMEVDEVPYVKPTRADLEEILDRDFNLKLLLEGDSIRTRVGRALSMRFPSARSLSS
jgi:hypothetical protein